MEKIVINQTLHGYDDGHRLLSSSMNIANESSNIMLSLSDLSGHGLVPKEDGYLTGYPLPKMGMYALARTWNAHEISRPGCVWTHTLLIDFADLAFIDEFNFINLFKRPTAESINEIDYSCEFFVERGFNVDFRHNLNRKYTSLILNALYTKPNASIFLKLVENISLEKIILAIWFQQWPRLRRNFRFCTWTSADRSRLNETFDIQIISSEKTFIEVSKSKKQVEYIDLDIDFTCQNDNIPKFLIDDVLHGDSRNPFRKYLWRCGAESNDGRMVFLKVCKIWEKLQSNNVDDITNAIELHAKIQPKIDAVGFHIFNKLLFIISSNQILPECLLTYLFDFISNYDGKDSKNVIEEIGKIIGKQYPTYIWNLFDSNKSTNQKIALIATKYMKVEDVFANEDIENMTFKRIVEYRPDICVTKQFWELYSANYKYFFNVSNYSNDSLSKILNILLDCTNPEAAKPGIELFGKKAINIMLKGYDNFTGSKKELAKVWISESAHYPKLLLECLEETDSLTLDTLLLLTTLLNYKEPSPDTDMDVWIKVIRKTNGVTDQKPIDFCTYLLARAFSKSSPNTEKLIVWAFDSLHEELLMNNLAKKNWELLKSELPRVKWWKEWDMAYRLRLAVVKAFVKMDLPKLAFFKTTEKDSTFKDLVKIANNIHWGKRYLQAAYSFSMENQEAVPAEYPKIIKRELDYNLI